MSIRDEVQALCLLVPREPLTTLPSPASIEEIGAAEAALRVRFPSELIEFLRVTNGPCIGPGGLYGVAPCRESLRIERRLERHSDWITRGWIPVAGDGCGNSFVLLAKGSLSRPICFVEATSPSTLAYVVASDLWHFLRFLLGRELGETGWPFQQHFVVQRDPAIVDCQIAPLPWSK